MGSDGSSEVIDKGALPGGQRVAVQAVTTKFTLGVGIERTGAIGGENVRCGWRGEMWSVVRASLGEAGR